MCTQTVRSRIVVACVSDSSALEQWADSVYSCGKVCGLLALFFVFEGSEWVKLARAPDFLTLASGALGEVSWFRRELEGAPGLGFFLSIAS